MTDGSRSWEGGCLCGAVRLRIEGTPRYRAYCHCRSCRLAAGAVPVAWATFDLAALRWVRGEPATYRSSPPVRRRFCAQCGCALSYEHDDRPGQIDVAVANLDDSAGLEPRRHIWLSDTPAWARPKDGLPGHERGAADD